MSSVIVRCSLQASSSIHEVGRYRGLWVMLGWALIALSLGNSLLTCMRHACVRHQHASADKQRIKIVVGTVKPTIISFQEAYVDFLEQLTPFSRLFACLASTCEDVRVRVCFFPLESSFISSSVVILLHASSLNSGIPSCRAVNSGDAVNVSFVLPFRLASCPWYGLSFRCSSRIPRSLQVFPLPVSISR